MPVQYETFPLGDSNGTQLAEGGYPSIDAVDHLERGCLLSPYRRRLDDYARNSSLA